MATTVTTKLIDPQALLAGIFLSEGDILAPMEVLPEHLGDRDFPRSLSEEFKLQEKMTIYFASAVAVSIMGQYSLMRKKTIFAVARLCAYMRPVMPEEARMDFDNFGEQVMGDEFEGKTNYPYKAVINFFGKKYLYTGPHRTTRTVQTVRIKQGDCPAVEEVKEMMDEVDSVKHKPLADEEIAYGDYVFVLASLGKISMRGFKKIDDLHLNNLQFIGEVATENEKLIFFPEGERDHPINFSSNIYR